MLLTHVTIENFRAHTHTEIPLTRFGCLIGENNAGKSTVLHAIQFALEERKIAIDDFNNPEEPVRVTLKFTDIRRSDLERVPETHRNKIQDIIKNNSLSIIRIQPPKSSEESTTPKAISQYLKPVPRLDRLSEEKLMSTLEGKRKSELRNAAVGQIPELGDLLSDSPNKTEIKDSYNRIIRNLPESELKYTPHPYPTGISAGLKPLFPTVIYVEAVKDVAAETKTTTTSTFGKLLTLLFNEVSDKFKNIDVEFQNIHKRLSKTTTPEGEEIDERLDEVKLVESTIANCLNESFPDVKLSLDVPAPTLSTLLSSADIKLDDGYEGSVKGKGDGLKRTVLFSILRAYAHIKNEGLRNNGTQGRMESTYILLFEEPELYLHPRAQRQLMTALSTFSDEYQVLVTTHSPTFFQLETKGFSKLQKIDGGIDVHTIDLQIDQKQAYQLIHYENNEAAFFSNRIVLVEGESDTTTFPYIAKLINPRWDNSNHNIIYIKTDGKSNILKYKSFFEQFNTEVHTITDLDSLYDAIHQLTSNEDIIHIHSQLRDLLNNIHPSSDEPNAKRIKRLTAKSSRQNLWRESKRLLQEWSETKDPNTAKQLEECLDELFSIDNTNAWYKELQNPSSQELTECVDELIRRLAEERVYVLRRGDLEAYCKSTRRSKVDQAIEFQSSITSINDFTLLHGNEASDIIDELSSIFSAIYQGGF